MVAAGKNHNPRHRLLVVGVLGLFFVLGFCYSLVVPPFESPDEVYHYAFARHLAAGSPLPVQTVNTNGPWEHEGTQAPLYYFLVGRLTSGIDQGDFDQLSVHNPRANVGNPLFPGNKSRMLYSARTWPLVGTNLALHIGRWFSLLLATCTLWLVYRIARMAFPGSFMSALLAMALVASIPQFAYISSVVTNDNMVTLLATAVLFWLARLLSVDSRRPIWTWEWLVLGVLLGLSALSKLQGLGLFGLAGLAVVWLAVRRRSWRLVLRAAAFVILPALVIAGWWYWRNHSLYGEWLGVRQLLTINGLRVTPRTWRGFWGEMRGLRYSFWGLFGWFSILLPVWIYRVLDGLSLAAAIGVALAAIRSWRARARSEPSGTLSWLSEPGVSVKVLLGVWAVGLIGLMAYWSTVGTSSQGRLLFPGISAFGVLIVMGLSFWLRVVPRRARTEGQHGLRRLRARLVDQPLTWIAVLPVLLVFCTFYVLAVLLPASYHAPGPVAALPASAREIHITYDDQIELVGVSLPDGRFEEGDEVPVTLFLRSLKKLPADYQLFIQFLQENRVAIANVTTHPGWGRNPTSLWEPGKIYPDSYSVRITGPVGSRSPLQAPVYVGFVSPSTNLPLLARGVDGAESAGVVGSVQIAATEPKIDNAVGLNPIRAEFDDGIRLIAFQIPAVVPHAYGRVPLVLLWEAYGNPGTDYTAFVHLTSADGRGLATVDQPPAPGRFPTHEWKPGDQILSEMELELPQDLKPGRYELWTGLYRSESAGKDRLPVVTSGRPTRDQQVLLGTMEVR